MYLKTLLFLGEYIWTIIMYFSTRTRAGPLLEDKVLSVGFIWVTQERVGRGMWCAQEVKNKIMNLQIEF